VPALPESKEANSMGISKPIKSMILTEMIDQIAWRERESEGERRRVDEVERLVGDVRVRKPRSCRSYRDPHESLTSYFCSFFLLSSTWASKLCKFLRLFQLLMSHHTAWLEGCCRPTPRLLQRFSGTTDEDR
jgi:hypothetical protein